MTSEVSLNATVPAKMSGCRFDQVAVDLFPDYSRSRIQSWIRCGELTLDGKAAKPKTRVVGGEQLQLLTTLIAEGDWIPQDIELDILYQDSAIIVINKPAGLVVHPAAGNRNGTLLNGLLFQYPELKQVPRAGIVHRLDKDTSGLMVVARTLESQNSLVCQLQERSVSREYCAIVQGECNIRGVIDEPVGRHPTIRTKMAVLKSNGKPAITHFECLEHLGPFSYVRLKLTTGRTHQIRVHMAYTGLPLVGDPVYGRPFSAQMIRADRRFEAISEFPRQALHAARLGLKHPKTEASCEWASDLPKDFFTLLAYLREQY